MSVLLELLIAVGALSTFFCVGLTIAYGGLDNISFRSVFACQTELWKNTGDLTTTGRVLLICLVTPFILPSNILFLFAYAMSAAMIGAWRLYKYIFRKREADST